MSRIEAWAQAIAQGDRGALARGITLVENIHPAFQAEAQQLLQAMQAYPHRAIKIGITGPPGVGKSSLIEVLGQHVLSLGKRLAVLTIDPSSPVSGGSVLGDKTRMPTLANHPQAFIRPSASWGTSGGVSARTKDVVTLCEAAGFDVVVVETVGAGQTDTAVSGMVDVVVGLWSASLGDDLQGFKRGIMEVLDIIAVAKADDPSSVDIQRAVRMLNASLAFLPQRPSGLRAQVVTVSAHQQLGIAELWQAIVAVWDTLQRQP